MRFFVTGATGLVGTDLLPELTDAGHWCCAERVEITAAKEVAAAIQAAQPDWVVHLAAYTDVDGAEADERRALAVNGGGTRNVARAARDARSRLLVVSTDYVYNGQSSSAYSEDAPTQPESAYGRTKLAGEQAATAQHPDPLIVRTAWVFGPGGQNFVDTMLRLADERDTIDVVDDQRGSPTYTAHLARGLRLLAERQASGVVHVAGGGETTWCGFAREIMRQAQIDPGKIRPTTSDAFKRPARRPACSVLATARYADWVGEAMPDWHLGLAAYLNRRDGMPA